MANILVVLSAVVLLSFATIHTQEFDSHKNDFVYTVTIKNEQIANALKILSKQYDFWDRSFRIHTNTRVLVPKHKQKNFELFLTNQNIKFSKTNAQILGQNEIMANNRVKTSRSKLGITFEKYYRFDEINNYLEGLAQTYSNISKLITIGKTYEGRDLKVIHISTGGHGSKPAMFIDGGIHAREWISPANVLYIIHQLVKNSNKNFELIDKLDWYLLPVINADGYEYTFTKDRFWRKSRRPNKGSPDCVGTDLNRNFDYHWMKYQCPCSEVYPGEKPFSDKESQAVRDFGLKIRDKLVFYLSFHSYGSYILYPWGWTTELPKNEKELKRLGNEVNKALNGNYRIGTIADLLYPAYGTSVDWFMGRLGTNLSYTIELPSVNGTGFDFPPDKILATVSDTFKGVKVFAKLFIN